MAPPPTNAPPSSNPTHSRNTSTSALKPDGKTMKPQDVHFTALIRLPFPRGDFVDPPQVNWDSTKDKALWKIISRTSKTSELDWQELASRFEVPHTFILQQAAWLYERHLSHVRAQMRKVHPAASAAPTASTSTTSTPPVGAVPMKRLGSGGASRTPSALSLRTKLDNPKPDSESAASPRSGAPPLSRTPSTTTVTQSRVNTASAPPVTGTSPRQPLQRSFRSSFGSSRKASPAIPGAAEDQPTSPISPSAADSNSSSDSSDEAQNPIKRSAIFKRPPRFKKSHKSPLAPLDDASENDPDDDLDSSDPAFLPFANAPLPLRPTPSQQPDKQPTRDRPPPPAARPNQHPSAPSKQIHSSTSAIDSSESSLSSAAPTQNHDPSKPKSAPFSPSHRAELGRLNPHKLGSIPSGGSPSGKGRPGPSGSDGGTPSMGSSFSDLEVSDSLSDSALVEALASNMQHGRMSTLSSLRSRYLPG